MSLFGNTKQKAINLVEEAVALKHRGDFGAALEKYRQAARLYPKYDKIYFGAGKLFYLLENQPLSLANYLMTAHMWIQAIYKDDQRSKNRATSNSHVLLMRRTEEDMTVGALSFFSSIHPAAKYVVVLNNLTRHIGHALIDFNEEYTSKMSPRVLEHIAQYEQGLAGNQIKEAFDFDLDEDMYCEIGRGFILLNLAWKELHKQPTSKHYLTSQIYVDEDLDEIVADNILTI